MTKYSLFKQYIARFLSFKWNLCIDHKNHTYFRDTDEPNCVNIWTESVLSRK